MVTAQTPNYFYTQVLFLTIIPRIESSKWDMSASQSTLLRFIYCFCVCTSITVISLDFCLVMMPPPFHLFSTWVSLCFCALINQDSSVTVATGWLNLAGSQWHFHSWILSTRRRYQYLLTELFAGFCNCFGLNLTFDCDHFASKYFT
jgi:hypothetical protein